MLTVFLQGGLTSNHFHLPGPVEYRIVQPFQAKKTNDGNGHGGHCSQACLVLSHLLLTVDTKLNPSDALQEGRIDQDVGECCDL